MSKQLRIAIVGGGFAGLSTAFQFVKRSTAQIVIFDKHEVGKGGASSVSTGFLHPTTPNGKLIWNGSKAFESSIKFISEIEKSSKESILHQKQHAIIRPLFTTQELEKWKLAAKRNPEWIEILSPEQVKSFAGIPTDTKFGPPTPPLSSLSSYRRLSSQHTKSSLTSTPLQPSRPLHPDVLPFFKHQQNQQPIIASPSVSSPSSFEALLPPQSPSEPTSTSIIQLDDHLLGGASIKQGSMVMDCPRYLKLLWEEIKKEGGKGIKREREHQNPIQGSTGQCTSGLNRVEWRIIDNTNTPPCSSNPSNRPSSSSSSSLSTSSSSSFLRSLSESFDLVLVACGGGMKSLIQEAYLPLPPLPLPPLPLPPPLSSSAASSLSPSQIQFPIIPTDESNYILSPSSSPLPPSSFSDENDDDSYYFGALSTDYTRDNNNQQNNKNNNKNQTKTTTTTNNNNKNNHNHHHNHHHHHHQNNFLRTYNLQLRYLLSLKTIKGQNLYIKKTKQKNNNKNNNNNNNNNNKNNKETEPSSLSSPFISYLSPSLHAVSLSSSLLRGDYVVPIHTIQPVQSIQPVQQIIQNNRDKGGREGDREGDREGEGDVFLCGATKEYLPSLSSLPLFLPSLSLSSHLTSSSSDSIPLPLSPSPSLSPHIIFSILSHLSSLLSLQEMEGQRSDPHRALSLLRTSINDLRPDLSLPLSLPQEVEEVQKGKVENEKKDEDEYDNRSHRDDIDERGLGLGLGLGTDIDIDIDIGMGMEVLGSRAGVRLSSPRCHNGKLPLLDRLPPLPPLPLTPSSLAPSSLSFHKQEEGINDMTMKEKKGESNIWVFTALGSRGLLYHSLLSQHLQAAMMLNDPSLLPPEVRFGNRIENKQNLSPLIRFDESGFVELLVNQDQENEGD